MISPEQVHHATVFDDDTRRVAHVYGEAILKAATKRQQGAEVLQELEALDNEVLRRDPGLAAFLGSAAVSRERKEAALRHAFTDRCSEILLNFLLVLNAHDRLDVLQAVVVAYKAAYDREAGLLPVVVQSAVPLEAGQQDQLRQELRERFKREPLLETQVVPDLLGGLVVRVGDWVFDASVRTRINLIRKQLIERSSHEIQSGRDRFRSD
jgi:F-type H+-transporting ATPase subunit delta